MRLGYTAATTCSWLLLLLPVACMAGNLALAPCNHTRPSQLFKWRPSSNQIVAASDPTKCWDGDGGGVNDEEPIGMYPNPNPNPNPIP